MGELVVKRASVPARPFRWRTIEGQHMRPEQMRTSHMFNTISMIWNHSMPEEAHTHRFQRYFFSGYYTENYMKTAVRVMLPMLLVRSDLTSAQKARLDFMARYLQSIGEGLDQLSAPLTALPPGRTDLDTNQKY